MKTKFKIEIDIESKDTKTALKKLQQMLSDVPYSEIVIEHSGHTDYATLHMDYMEFGMLYAKLEMGEKANPLPQSMRLKLDILFSKAYLSHPTLGKQAAKDIKRYQAELKKLYKKPN